MKIVLMGDSITDMGRLREEDIRPRGFGCGYPFLLEAHFAGKHPGEHTLINRGISGNRVVDIYARIKADCWNFSPDLVTVLIGINDIWHELNRENGVDIDRYERVYRMYLQDTKDRFPHVKFMLLEPFVLRGEATEEQYDVFRSQTLAYAAVVKKLAAEFDAPFVPLQQTFDALAEKYGAAHWLFDGVHPTVAGATVIADAWLDGFATL